MLCFAISGWVLIHVKVDGYWLCALITDILAFRVVFCDMWVGWRVHVEVRHVKVKPELLQKSFGRDRIDKAAIALLCLHSAKYTVHSTHG